MITALAQALVSLLGIIVGLLSLWGIAAPTRLIKMVQHVMEQRSGIYIAEFVRLLLGVALIVSASAARYPKTFMVLGGIAILAALGLALMGREGMRRVVGWFDHLPPPFVRLWLVFGLAFSGILVYGAAWLV